MIAFVKSLIVVALLAGIASTYMISEEPGRDVVPIRKPVVTAPFAAIEPDTAVPIGQASLSGNAPAGATVSIMNGAKLVRKTIAGSDKKWSVGLPLGAGEYALTAQAQTYKTMVELNVFDPNRPTILRPKTKQEAVSNQVVEGLADPGSEILVLRNGVPYQRVHSDTLGLWSCPVTLAKGTNILTAKSIRGHASVAAFFKGRTHIKPVQIKVQPMAEKTLIRGIASPGDRVVVFNREKAIGTATANQNGNWTFTYTGTRLGSVFHVTRS